MKIKIEYNSGNKPVKYSGDNMYPYNFDSVKELFTSEDEG